MSPPSSDLWVGFCQAEQKEFCLQSRGCSVMLEFLSASNEHIFPIDRDCVQFVAVL